jgi:outer membrane lipoprotein LolB
MTRLIRLLPLAALVLTACTVTQPKGPGKSPDSPQWRQHQQDVRNLSQYQTRGAFAISLMSKKCMPVSSGSRRVRTTIACCC